MNFTIITKVIRRDMMLLCRRQFSSTHYDLLSKIKTMKVSNNLKELIMTANELNSTHMSSLIWELAESNQCSDALNMYRYIEAPSLSHLRSDSATLATISVYGRLKQPSQVFVEQDLAFDSQIQNNRICFTQARQRALLVADKALSADIASLLLSAYSRTDR